MDSWASSPFRGWEVGLEIQPFGIGEVGRVALSHAPERTRSLCSGAFSNSLRGLILGNPEGVERAAVVRPQLCDLSISGFQAPPWPWVCSSPVDAPTFLDNRGL